MAEDVLDNLTIIPEDEDLTTSLTLADDPFEAVAAGSDAELTGEDLTITRSETPQPVGKGWLFDWGTETFYRAGGRRPLEVHGNRSLDVWIEKCLHTDRDATPVSPTGYGLEGGIDAWGVGDTSRSAAPDIAARVRDALTFHPRIADVTSFRLAYGDDGSEVSVAFTVVLDDDQEFQFTTTVGG